MVLNLGVGLDARPIRLALPPTLTWVEDDSSQIIEQKQATLPSDRAKCRLSQVACDPVDPRQRARLLGALDVPGNALVVTEGVLPYLSEAFLATLTFDLARCPGSNHWLLDLMSPGQLARQRRNWGKQLGCVEEMHFGPSSGLAFFSSSGWRIDKSLSLVTEAKRLGREMRLSPIIRFIASIIGPVRKEREQAVTLAVLGRSRGAAQ